jgi:glutamate-1-semialdehyde aminotransferase
VAIIREQVFSSSPLDSMQPWFVKRLAMLTHAVGRISVADRQFGTGFLIAPGTILTCHHVLPDAQTRCAKPK